MTLDKNLQYCIQKACPQGSSLHYALRYGTPDQRVQAIPLFALHIELQDIVIDCSDLQVATSKLAWWRDELRRLYHHQANHPATLMLQTNMTSIPLAKEYFDEMCDAIEMDLQYSAYPTFKQLTLYCHRLSGTFAQLVTEALGGVSQQSRDFAHHFGMYVQLSSFILNFRQHRLNGHLYIPEDELQAHGIDLAMLDQALPNEAVQRLFAQQWERALDFKHKALRCLTKPDIHRQMPHLLLGELIHHTIEEIATNGFRLMAERVELTPLRKLWLTWRDSRKLLRQ